MTPHLIYFGIVMVACAIGLYILGPGSVFTLVFLMGLITIPIAFLFGTIPMISLLLLLSLPFYILLAVTRPTRVLRNITASILIAIVLSVATATAARVKLIGEGEALAASDFVQSVSFQDKFVELADQRNWDRCHNLCQQLVLIGGARTVALIKKESKKTARSGLRSRATG